MLKKLVLFSIIISLLVFNLTIITNNVFASGATDKAKAGLDAAAPGAGFSTPAADPAGVIGKALKVVTSILGIIFVIIVVYGGITWMTAGGNADQVKKARSMLIEGVLGMAVTMGAYAIAYYFVEKLSTAAGV